jgi:hypothetical protein
MGIIKVRFNEAEIRAFLNDPSGPVARLMADLGGYGGVCAGEGPGSYQLHAG